LVKSDLGRLASEYGLTLMSEFGDTNVGQFSAPNAPDDIFMFLKIKRTDASIFTVKLYDIVISRLRIGATNLTGQL
jgi:hypothetical protein